MINRGCFRGYSRKRSYTFHCFKYITLQEQHCKIPRPKWGIWSNCPRPYLRWQGCASGIFSLVPSLNSSSLEISEHRKLAIENFTSTEDTERLLAVLLVSWEDGMAYRKGLIIWNGSSMSENGNWYVSAKGLHMSTCWTEG